MNISKPTLTERTKCAETENGNTNSERTSQDITLTMETNSSYN